MSASPARFFWYQLMTPDTETAEAFYREVVGWTFTPYPGPHDYTVLETGGVGVAGMMALDGGMIARGARPGWAGYLHVENVDASVARVMRAGGAVHRSAEDVPGVGRIAVVSDPQGAVFFLMTPGEGMTRPEVPRGAAGTVGWHELMAVDGPAAFDFYSGLFGWTNTGVHSMGPMGDYLLFGIGDEAIGGIMTKPPHLPSPYWSYYFRVDGAAAAAERVKAAGGTVAHGPMEVPSGDWVLQGFDPDGAWFALVSARG